MYMKREYLLSRLESSYYSLFLFQKRRIKGKEEDGLSLKREWLTLERWEKIVFILSPLLVHSFSIPVLYLSLLKNIKNIKLKRNKLFFLYCFFFSISSTGLYFSISSPLSCKVKVGNINFFFFLFSCYIVYYALLLSKIRFLSF